MIKIVKPLCNSHVAHLNMSMFVPEDVTSSFAEIHWITGQALSAPVSSLLYPTPPAEILVDEEEASRVVAEFSRAIGESSDEEEVVDVAGRVSAGVESSTESKGSTFVDALKRASVVTKADPETVIDILGTPTCN